MRESSSRSSRAFAEGVISRGRRRRRGRARLHRPAVLRRRLAGPAGRDVHRQPQPGAVQRHQDVPGRRRADRPGLRAGHHPRLGRARQLRPRRPARGRRGDRSATSWPSTPPTCARWSTCPGIRPLKVVVDAGNGMGGHTVPVVLAGLPLDVVPLYFELDGSFPNHEANPLDPANLVDLQAGGPRARRRHRAGLRRRRRPRASSSTSGASRSARRRSPRWSPSASWPRAAGRRSSTT